MSVTLCTGASATLRHAISPARCRFAQVPLALVFLQPFRCFLLQRLPTCCCPRSARALSMTITNQKLKSQSRQAKSLVPMLSDIGLESLRHSPLLPLRLPAPFARPPPVLKSHRDRRRCASLPTDIMCICSCLWAGSVSDAKSYRPLYATARLMICREARSESRKRLQCKYNLSKHHTCFVFIPSQLGAASGGPTSVSSIARLCNAKRASIVADEFTFLVIPV